MGGESVRMREEWSVAFQSRARGEGCGTGLTGAEGVVGVLEVVTVRGADVNSIDVLQRVDR